VLEIENKLRIHISEIITPFNERVETLKKEVKQLQVSQESNRDNMININSKLDREVKLRDFVQDLHQKQMNSDKNFAIETQKINGSILDFKDRIKTLQEFCEMTQKTMRRTEDKAEKMQININNYETLLGEFQSSMNTD
jgi:chromosome segregation ATPase